MEILFDYRGSRRKLRVAEKDGVTRVVSDELRRVGKPRAQVFTASDNLPSGGGGGQKPDVYLLQRWSSQWDCYVDVGHYNEVGDGDKLAVIAKPKPSSLFTLLCCCKADSSYDGKVGGSGKLKIPKSEEIQSLEYRFRVESEAGSILDESHAVLEDHATKSTDDPKDGEQYIRADSGRAAWKLVQNLPGEEDSTVPVHREGDGNEELEQRPREGDIQEQGQGEEDIQEEAETTVEREREGGLGGEELKEGNEENQEAEGIVNEGMGEATDEEPTNQEDDNEDVAEQNASPILKPTREEISDHGEDHDYTTKHEEVPSPQEDVSSPSHVSQSHISEPEDTPQNIEIEEASPDDEKHNDSGAAQVEAGSNPDTDY